MSTASIFPVLSIDRKLTQWEDYLLKPTPVEQHGSFYFKREDYFAPLGYGGINGSKLRQAIWLMKQAVDQGSTGVIHGAVTGSPQHPMIAAIARHYGIPAVSVIGTKDITKHETLLMAKQFGASFLECNVGYAKTLENKAMKAVENGHSGYFWLETNITVDAKRNPASRVEQFHRLGSEQVANIENVESIIVPAGSCNSVVSVLYGIARFRPKGLKKIILMGIGAYGSSNPGYVYERLGVIEQAVGTPLRDLFRPRFVNDPGREPLLANVSSDSYELVHFNVNNGCGACSDCEGGFCEYNDLMPASYHGIELHPRYEGKTFHYMHAHKEAFKKELGDGARLYWIVGSKPSAQAMAPVLKGI